MKQCEMYPCLYKKHFGGLCFSLMHVCLLSIEDYICAVIMEGPKFAVNDSHSPNDKGMAEYAKGTSIVTYCNDIHVYLC